MAADPLNKIIKNLDEIKILVKTFKGKKFDIKISKNNTVL